MIPYLMRMMRCMVICGLADAVRMRAPMPGSLRPVRAGITSIDLTREVVR